MYKKSSEECLTIRFKWLLIIEKLCCQTVNGGDVVDIGALIYLTVCLNRVCIYSGLIRPHISLFMTATSNKAARAAPLCSR